MNLEQLLVSLRWFPMTKCQLMRDTKLQSNISQISVRKLLCHIYQTSIEKTWVALLLSFMDTRTKIGHLDVFIKPYRLE